jgi:hypothetical protein
MKITKTKLRQLILKELKSLKEADVDIDYDVPDAQKEDMENFDNLMDVLISASAIAKFDRELQNDIDALVTKVNEKMADIIGI